MLGVRVRWPPVLRAAQAAPLLLLLIAAFACVVRLYRLDARPMHPDEANQAVRAGILQSTGRYEYDPTEHHGPTLYYLALPGAWLTAGREFAATTEATFRAVPAWFGAGLILLLLLVRQTLGWSPVVISGIFIAVSPAMVYYSRFFIQETLLVFFTFGLIAAAWRYLQRPGPGWAMLAGLFAALMFATKETCVLSWAALCGALVLAAWLCPAWRAAWPIGQMRWRHLGATLAAASVVTITLFSSFFTHWQGVRDAVLAYTTYAGRAGAEGWHNHPWHFYLHRLAWFRVGRGPVFSEGLVLALALAGIVSAFRRRNSPERALPLLLALYTVLLTAIYSAISYKTPWCTLSFLHGFMLLAGVGAVEVIRLIPRRLAQTAAVLVIGAGVLQLGRQAWTANTRFAADPRNPWCYAQTSTDLLRLDQRLREIAAVHPDGTHMPIAVVQDPNQVWPLPWYLRKFPNAGFWQRMEELPPQFQPVIVVAAPDQQTPIDGQSQSEYYGLRPDVILAVHIRKQWWDRFLETRSVQPRR